MEPSLQPEDLSPADLDLLRRGDARGLEAIYRRFGAPIQRTCLALLGNRADAEDATQEVFVKALERARQFARGSRFSTWLYRIAVNHCLHRREKVRVRRALPLEEAAAGVEDAAPGPREVAGAREARDIVLARLARLSDEHRAILVLRELDGLGYEEIAAVLDVPVGTVMSRLSRARQRWIELEPRRREPSSTREPSAARGGGVR